MNLRNALRALLVVLLSAGWATAQTDLPPVSEERPALDDLTGQTISPEQLEAFLKEARQRRLAMEREQVAAEIREGLLFDPSKVDAAVKGLSEGAKNTWADNAQRICQAYALVDGRFAKAYDLFVKGDYEAAAGAFKPLISERDTTYLAAAKRFCHAEALARLSRNDDAVEAYTDLVKAMPDRFSFSAQALLNAGRTYEKTNRLQYAMALYRLWVDSFGLLDPDTAKDLSERADKIAADYRDPLGTLAGKMEDVEKRLAQTDSGRVTQQKQREIVTMLDDLIATAEEASSASSQGQGQQQGQKQGEGQGEGQGQGQGQGQGRGPAQGLGIPSSPATLSRLVGGPVLRPTGVSEVRPSDPTDDWGKLPPVEREKLLETFKETMPERYREMISDYYKRLASGQPAR